MSLAVSVKHVCGKLVEVEVEGGDFVVDTGILDKEEALAVARELAAAVEELLCFCDG